MTDDGRILAAYLLTTNHANMLGCFYMPAGYVAEDLKWSIERVREGFAELFQKGFATFSEGSNWVVIHTFLKWNQLENPNVVKAAVKLFDQIPDDCGLKPLLARFIGKYEKRFPAAKLNPIETVLEPYRTQDQKQDQEPEPKPELEEEQQQASAVVVLPPGDGYSSPVAKRATAIAVFLRQRGVPGANSANPNIQGWADDARVSDELLDAALSKARSSLGSKPAGVNYLAPIIADLLNPIAPPRMQRAPTWTEQNATTIANLTGQNRHVQPDERIIDV
ncbi:hypothetical protein [Burkholderia glumae]|uniref:hypothetical protein n=1 Tax=Burkholderia glumae TaxID=337 RepID=UPI0021511D44|nr:hypothetical protein [Burkholderia glumae]